MTRLSRGGLVSERHEPRGRNAVAIEPAVARPPIKLLRTGDSVSTEALQHILIEHQVVAEGMDRVRMGAAVSGLVHLCEEAGLAPSSAFCLQPIRGKLERLAFDRCWYSTDD